MSIKLVQPLHVGNAIRLFLDPPSGAKYWRVLKMGSDSFGGAEDLDYALIVHEGTDRVFVDSQHLKNEVMVFYKPYYRMADDTWLAAPAIHATPSATFEDQSTDVQSFVRTRIEEGLKIEVERGNLVHELGYVQVMTAPPGLEQNLRFPLVTITLDGETPYAHGIGEDIAGDEFDVVTGEYFDSEGWLASVQLSIAGWSLNSDERIELRQALRRIIVANLPVFDDRGMVQIETNFTDVDLISGEFNVNLYQVMCSFSCLAPVRVGHNVGTIREVITTARSTYDS